jgi:hypothetical protein
MSWASNRKFKYEVIVVIVVFFIAMIPVYLYINKPATCVDNKQNGDEIGIDCGGSCDTLCAVEVNKPIVHWSRPFKVVDGVYDIVAFVENPNFKAKAKRVIYKFKLYDENNILVSEKLGKTFIGPNEQFAVFESNIKTGERIPKKALFEFEPDIKWSRVTTLDINTPNIFARDKKVSDLESKPRLKTLLVNSSPFDVKNIEVVAVLYDINDNAIAVSKTIVDLIEKKSTKNIVFTWNEPFMALPTRVEILPRVNAI